MMHSGGDNRSLDVCYNTITTTDAKHKLIVDFEVTNQPNDSGSLHTTSEKAKEIMGVKTLTNLADKGFYDGEDIAAYEADGASCLVAKPKTHGPKKGVEFGHERFVYNKELDCYVCPCEKQLLFKRMDKYNGVMCRAYENYVACRVCLRRSECTKGRGRKIMRYPHAGVLDVVDVRTKNGKEVYYRRREIVEHPFGVVKVVWV
ncbi:MAG: transposase [Candidatus Bathyarchaeota archaeon]|uniref:transposase n=1 Tax=Candidatus Bathycorpusculum sp. TaxID=2994959 RepID=UPI00281B47A4|nr:transposase [Candidatus Termiticorpusculum sp.]MCL2291689.1 transposase [Candidatus Termiticorpusculum sp.]